MKPRIIWRNPDGTLAITALINPNPTTDDLLAYRDKVIASGKHTLADFAGIHDQDAFPPMAYWPAWRISADAIVVKLDLARIAHWQNCARDARKLLPQIQQAWLTATMEADTIRQSALSTRLTVIKQLITTMPAEVANATTLDNLATIRPAALDDPIP